MCQILRFQAVEVSFAARDDENIAYAFFSNVIFPNTQYLMVNRFLGPDKRSDVFVEYSNQSRVAQGGITLCELTPNNIIFSVKPQTAKALGILFVNQIIVDFELAAPVLADLKDSLSAIFDDFLIRPL